MTTKQLQDIKYKIIEELEALNNEIAELQEQVKPIAPDCSLGSDIRFEMMHMQQVYEKALHEAKIRVNKLKYALQKVDKEGYGICAECEEEIPYKRLLILPESLHCTECASNL